MASLSNQDQGRVELARAFAEHSSRVYGFLLARCGDRALAQDLTGDTFVAAAKAVAEQSRPRLDASWLITVARRRLVDHWRRAASYRSKLEQLRAVEDRDRSIKAEPESESVFVALQTLPARQQAALTLRYLDDFSLHEVAEALEISYRAAESLVGRARRSFAAAYQAEEQV